MSEGQGHGLKFTVIGGKYYWNGRCDL